MQAPARSRRLSRSAWWQRRSKRQALAFCAAFAGGLPAGKGRLGPGGSLLNAGAFALLLLLLCFGGWGEGIAVRGLILLALILLGGLLAALLCGKVGKRSNKRLVKSHKKLRSV